MKFDAIVGNPPYQTMANGDATGSDPIYHLFIDAACKIGNRVTFIHPARFLFNAGKTPKEWNKKMLSDEHFKVIHYWAKSTDVFSTVDIKGGVAITYWDRKEKFGAIGTFTAFDELATLKNKVEPTMNGTSLSDIIFTQTRFNLATLYEKHPELKAIIGSDGADKRFRNNAFDKVPVFTKDKKEHTDIKVLGVIGNKREWRYIPREFVDMTHENISLWKVLVPRANGSGALGEVLSTPLIGEPLIGYTQTFIGIGAFKTKYEAEAAIKYIKTKFARCMLGILKITQDNDRETWRCVPIQDFSSSSDIDWSQSVSEIDQQLYKKYNLSPYEIAFIEENVQPME